MQSKLLHEANGARTFAVILQKGDEAMRCLQDFAVKERIGGAQVTVIGALSSAKLAFFDWETKQYQPIPVDEQVCSAVPLNHLSASPGCPCLRQFLDQRSAQYNRLPSARPEHHSSRVPPDPLSRP